MKRIGLLLYFALLYCSCGELLPESSSEKPNPNKEFYGTEWSTSSQEEGLKFYNNNSVLFFSNNANISTKGSFQYDPENKSITFEGLTTTGSPIYEITHASLPSETKMKVYYHEIGKSKGYYTELYKRR